MELLIELGFSKQDAFIIFLCPVFSVLGGVVHLMQLDTDFNKLPSGGGLHKPGAIIGRLKWSVSRFSISFVIGLVFALYFVGSVNDGPSAIAKLLAFSIMLGYVAPRVWSSQDNIIAPAIEDKLRNLVDEHLTKRSKGPS